MPITLIYPPRVTLRTPCTVIDGIARLSIVRWTVLGVTAQPHPPHLNLLVTLHIVQGCKDDIMDKIFVANVRIDGDSSLIQYSHITVTIFDC